MKNFKILILFIFIICLSTFVFGREESEIINLDLDNNNLTMTVDGSYWWFNISGGILDVNVNHTFEVYPEIISNCSTWFDFNWDNCFNVNDNLRSINTRLEKQLAGCEEPTSDVPGNPQCWKQSIILENKTKDLGTCKTDLSTKINERDNLQIQYNTCVTVRDNKYDKNNTNLLFAAIVGGGFFFFFYLKKGKTTDQKQIEKKKGGPDMDGVDKKELANDMGQDGVV